MNHEARRRRLDFSNGRKQLDNLYKRDKGICQLCNRPVAREDASRDHIKKFSECETQEEARSMANLQLAHILCNEARDKGLPMPIDPTTPAHYKAKGSGHMHQQIGKTCPELAKWLEMHGFSSESD